MKPDTEGTARYRWRGLVLASCGLVILLVLWPRSPEKTARSLTSTNTIKADVAAMRSVEGVAFPFNRQSASPVEPAEEIVAKKLAHFARSRRDYALALAKRHNVQMPPDVEQFFAAVESGNWDDIEAAFKKINGGDSSAGQAERPPGVARLWPAIIDAFGAAEQVHLWPAQQLLDYGNGILDALRPGMVYVGGTDNGRWIPELLNETSDGEHHIVVTQKSLADGSYQEYLRLQYDDRMANLSDEESKSAFDTYIADAQKRLEHDQHFPNEPKQLLPVNGLANLLSQNGRADEAAQIVNDFEQKYPDQRATLEQFKAGWRVVADSQPPRP